MRPATRSGCGWGWVVTEVSDEERLARAALTCVAEPGDPVMGALLRSCSPAEIVTALVRGRVPVQAAGAAGPGRDRPPGLNQDGASALDQDAAPALDQDGAPALDQDGPPGPDWDGLPGLDRARLPGLDRAGLPGLDRALSRSTASWAGPQRSPTWMPGGKPGSGWCARAIPNGQASSRSSATPGRGGCGCGGAGTSAMRACARCRSWAPGRRLRTARTCAPKWPRRWPSGGGPLCPAARRQLKL